MTRTRAVLRDLWRTFVADPVRENVVRAHGGGATAVSMVSLGLAAFAVAVVGVVLASSIGATPVGSDTAVLAAGAEPGLPVTIPLYFVPAYVGLVLVSTFLGVFGAVYATRGLATVAVLFVLVTTVIPAGFVWVFRDTTWTAYVGLPSALAVPLVVVLLRLSPPRPTVAQLVACVTALLAVVPAAWAQVDAYTTAGTAGGTTLMAQQAENVVGLLAFLVTPAALLAGAGAVSFGRTVTDFLARSLDTLSGRRAAIFLGVLIALLAWRVLASLVTLLGADDAGPMAAKAVLLVALTIAATAWWRWATRGFDETPDEVEEGSAKGTLSVSVLLLLLTVLLPGAIEVLVFLEISVLQSVTLVEVHDDLLDLIGRPRLAGATQIASGVALAAWAFMSARRSPSVVAAWVGVAGTLIVLVVCWNVTVSARDWDVPTRPDYARAVLVVVVVATVREWVRWRADGNPPSQGWMLTAFSAVALSSLVAQETFLDDPFQPLLGYTGVGLVFFGLVWGFLTSGAHSSARGLAGLGRATVMLSYAVLSTAIIAWGEATGGDVETAFAGALAAAGKAILGGALLVSLLAVWIPILYGMAEPAVREPEVGPKPHPEGRPEPTLSA